MTAPTHIATGLATVVVVGRVSGVTPDAVGLLAFIVGSLSPDIDGEGVITRPGTILRQLLGRGIALHLRVRLGIASRASKGYASAALPDACRRMNLFRRGLGGRLARGVGRCPLRVPRPAYFSRFQRPLL